MTKNICPNLDPNYEFVKNVKTYKKIIKTNLMIWNLLQMEK